MRTRLALTAVLAVALTACGSGGGESKPAAKPTPKDTSLAVAGVVKLTDLRGYVAANGADHAVCYGENGYDDLTEGAQIVIRDNAGKTVGLDKLQAGHLTGKLYADDTACQFTFSTKVSKAEGDIFSVEVAHRGQVQFKRADSGGLVLTLG